MEIWPQPEAFAAAYDQGRAQVVWTRRVADLETPVAAMLKLADGRANSFLLESVEGGAVRGRYSFIGLKPDLIWRCSGARAEINRRARYDAAAFEPCPLPALDSFRAIEAESRIDLPESLPPMAACLVGYMSYDMVRLMERLPDINPDPLGLPDGLYLRPTVMVIFDSVDDMMTIVTPARPAAGVDARSAYGMAAERLADIVADLDRNLRCPRARRCR